MTANPPINPTCYGWQVMNNVERLLSGDSFASTNFRFGSHTDVGWRTSTDR
jgi:hypothetical protein